MKPVVRVLAVCFCLLSLLAGSVLNASADAQGKKALMIVAKDDFEQNEYKNTRAELESAGVVCTVASTKKGMLFGNKGKRIQSDLTLAEANAADYDAIVIIGGNGIKKVWRNEDAHRLVKDGVSQDKVVAAICAGPGILAYADVLNGKTATAHPKSGAGRPMANHGCKYVNKAVVVDGKIITANGPRAAKDYGKAIVDAL